jgi:hypothetical protein
LGVELTLELQGKAVDLRRRVTLKVEAVEFVRRGNNGGEEIDFRHDGVLEVP